VLTARATVIDVGDPLPDAEGARAWLDAAGEDEVTADLAVLNRALHAHRLAAADPYVHGIGREDALVARVGYGAGEQVADGLWADARELANSLPPRRRRRIPAAQARFAALLTGRHTGLACEELVLRGRLDLDDGRDREAALQTLIALDAALAELSADATGPELAPRLDELRGLRDGVAAAAQTAMAGPLAASERDAVAHALARLEAALRARVAALPD
jgi:hypothetical protein